MQENNGPVENPGMEAVSRHDHLCLLYDQEAQILAPVIPFIQQGVALGERCVYLNAGEEILERVLINAIAGQKKDIGALKLLSVGECWLQGGRFDAGRVMALLESLCSSAAQDGFKGTRIICDMGWAGRESLRRGWLTDFELGLDLFTGQNEVTLLCLYHRGSFPAELMLELGRLHPQLVIGGKVCRNPFFLPSDRDATAPRASCELDLFLAAVETSASAVADRERLRQELEQAYAALARKIYENWQEEDTLRASEKELQEKDEALMEHRRRLQTILQHLPVLLMAFDPGNRLASCNHEFERATGFRAEEVMGKQMLELLEVEAQGREEVVLAHPPEGGDYRGVEWDLRCKDGSLRSVSWSNMSRYVPITGWPNWITGLDVTPRIRAELELRSLSDELQARTGELEAFGRAVSLELSDRLAKIGGHCAAMQELYGRALSPPARETLQRINEATLETVGSIAALQRFATLAARDLRPEQVDLSAMAAEIAARLGGSGGARRVTFSIEDGVMATGDKKLLHLALEQLLENAWNYTSGVPHPVIRFGAAQVEGERSFFVSDNGPRLADDPQAQPEPGRGGGARELGCGIGLATVQRIISLHRGRIWASDEAGKGTTFYFRV